MVLAIRHGFVEALEMEDSGSDAANVPAEQDGESANPGQGCRLVVLHLLSEGVNLPHPSLAHFLLGFNTQAPLSKYDNLFFVSLVRSLIFLYHNIEPSCSKPGLANSQEHAFTLF